MIDKLIACVAMKLKKLLGDEFAVYTESIEQGASMPCVFVECEMVERKSLLGGRFFLRVCVKVTIKSDSDTKRRETERLLGEILAALNKVEAESLTFYTKGIKGRWENEDFTIESVYDIFTEDKEGDAPMMETMDRGVEG